ncbi:double-stranded DNA-binding domain-containing protein [Cryptosporidium andersoni]|uniref:Double-stranded DNA-binding domain-containing protein n=1 Tax=Cryptosporidium andersoni TaxID=117008 RepID=A0A1J4MX61_9CRYT|nr:double-stranded DNA-binding domain-containing protein [Cryptosporidium andersoni]
METNLKGLKANSFIRTRDDETSTNEQKEEYRRQLEEQRRTALRALLEPSAIERLQRVALVKPEKAQLIEEHILKSAHMSGFSPANRISEDELINILSRMSNSSNSISKVTIHRREFFDDDEDF